MITMIMSTAWIPLRQDSIPKHDTPGDDRRSSREHADPEAEVSRGRPVEDYAAEMTAIFILEFGVVFHSIFVGLTLAVAGAEFPTLYVVLVFHQTFEGLGLGSRLAVTPWPKSKDGLHMSWPQHSLSTCCVGRWLGHQGDVSSRITDCAYRQRCIRFDKRWDIDLYRIGRTDGTRVHV
jgi:hypothetical protein